MKNGFKILKETLKIFPVALLRGLTSFAVIWGNFAIWHLIVTSIAGDNKGLALGVATAYGICIIFLIVFMGVWARTRD